MTDFDYVSDYGGCGSTNESVDDDEAGDILHIPIDLLTNAADLSGLYSDNALQTFEDVFAIEVTPLIRLQVHLTIWTTTYTYLYTNILPVATSRL